MTEQFLSHGAEIYRLIMPGRRSWLRRFQPQRQWETQGSPVVTLGEQLVQGANVLAVEGAPKGFLRRTPATDAQRWWIATGEGRFRSWVPADESGAAPGAVPFVDRFRLALPIHDYLP